MVRTSVIGMNIVALACVLLAPSAWAQQSSSGIAGVVKDTSGAVLPGVTVEAASPALIEKVRTVVTDGEGRYNIVDLRPGTYTVSFTLSGFSIFRREGIELTAGFTATVNAELRVGGLAETITVTGAAPLVDAQNVRQQNVLSSELLAALPTGQANLMTVMAVTPGVTVPNADVGGARGTFAGQNTTTGSYHGKRGTRVSYDGMRIQNSGGGAPGYMFNIQTVQEMTVETGGLSAETAATGIAMNLVPKEGGNAFMTGVSGLFTTERLQSNNLNDELRTRGLTSAQKVLNIYDAGVTVGGPIKQDRLWFFSAIRRWGSRVRQPELYWNATQGTPFYTPDLNRPASLYEWNRSHAVRLTWQASGGQKVNFYADIQQDCICTGRSIDTDRGNAPEAYQEYRLWPTGLIQSTWSWARTNRLLFEAGAAVVPFDFPNYPQPGVEPDHISILELSSNFTYNAAPFGYRRNPNLWMRYAQRASVSYVTGSHASKVGFQLDELSQDSARSLETAPHAVSYRFLNGVPTGLTQYALPYRQRDIGKADLGIYAQDQWIINRLTLNMGVRFDYVNGYVPAMHLPAGPFVPERNFAAVHKVPEWKDINPRVGAAYNLFGTGRTALKASFGRYGDLTSTSFTGANDPVVTSVNQANRSWTDTNRNYVPDCDLRNFAANGECGPIADQNFGKANPNATRSADDVLRGWGKRFFTWDITTELQHQIGSGVSVTGGYYRNWDGNFRVTDNVATTAADFDTYCITAPLDPRLPGGGGYQVCGLSDIKPEKFGRVTNLVTQASNYGKASRVGDFVGLSLNMRLNRGIRLGGGVDTGRSVADDCFAAKLPSLTTSLSTGGYVASRPANARVNCRVVTRFKANTQVKLNGSFPLPGDFTVSGTFQNMPGIEIAADYPAPTAEIAPSLGRPLAGRASTATVPLIAPQMQFEARLTQVDLRLTKIFGIGTKARLQANFDLYNALNANTILQVRNTYGSRWGQPLFTLDGRMIQFSGNLNF